MTLSLLGYVEKIYLKYRLIPLLCFLCMVGYGQDDVDELLHKGDLYYQQGDTTKAIESYAQAQSLDPSNTKAMYNLGKIYYDMGNYEVAESIFSKTLAENPSDDLRYKTLHNLGTTKLQNKKLEESVEYLKDALKMKPGDLETKYNLSSAIRQLQVQQQQQQQQKDQQEENNDQENEEKDENEQDQQEEKDGEKDENQKGDQDEQEGEDQEDQNSDNENQNSEGQEEEEQQAQSADELSDADAELMLQMLEERELESLNKSKKQHDGRASKSSKNW